MVTCSVSLCGPDPNTDYFNDKTFGTTKRERKILKVFKKNDKTDGLNEEKDQPVNNN